MSRAWTLLIQRKLVERRVLDRATLERELIAHRGQPAPRPMAGAFTELRRASPRVFSDSQRETLMAELPPGFAVALSDSLCRYERAEMAMLMQRLERVCAAREPVFWMGCAHASLPDVREPPPLQVVGLAGRSWQEGLEAAPAGDVVVWRQRART